MFPSLINSCTIDWFTEWPYDALEKVASKSLEDLDLDEDARRACVLMCVHFHQGGRYLNWAQTRVVKDKNLECFLNPWTRESV
jgi:hypothetical protein